MKKSVKFTVKTIAALFSITLILLAVPSLNAQQNLNDVRLFESYFFDTPISKKPYVEGGFLYGKYEAFNLLNVGAMGGFALNEKIELQANLNFVNLSPDEGDGQSGISDLDIYGRYDLSKKGPTTISAGGMLTLPIGSEDVGEGNMDFGGFGAVRHALQSGLVLTGNFGLMFYEVGEDRETSFNIGTGVIYPVNNQLSIVGEFFMQSEGDYTVLSGGVDYRMGTGHARGSLGLGLDDGAPDIRIMGSYSITL